MTLARTVIALGTLVAVFANSSRAQRLQYSYQAGDTVRFLETMDVSGTSTGRGGTLTIGITREARIALAFTMTDTVRAWYDALTMHASGANGQRSAETQSVVRVPFLLRVRSDGHAKTLTTPALPDLVRQLAEFYPPFDDFLALLPSESAPGASRTDTLRTRESMGDRRITGRRIIRSRVERDTLIDGQPAVIISVQANLRIDATGEGRSGDFIAKVALEGTETGQAVVSKSGAMLHRTRTGQAKGATTYTGRGAQVAVPQTYTYRSTIKAMDQ